MADVKGPVLTETGSPDRDPEVARDDLGRVALDALPKSRWERSWPVIATGAGLFSDGYIQGIIGPAITMLKRIYKPEFAASNAASNIGSIAFAGTVFGQLAFGYLSDHWSRTGSLLVSTIILIVFAILAAGSYGAGGDPYGTLAALTAFRFLVGIGIGGEYPAGSVACAEATGELKEGHRNRWFIMFTDFQIDFGFVVSALVAMIMVLITGEENAQLNTAWRVGLGLGAIPPLSLLYLRTKLKEPEEFNRETMKHVRTPWGLVIKFYGLRLAAVSLIWFIYDFSSYSFTTFASTWIDAILQQGLPDGVSPPLWKTFGFSVVVNLFYLPGSAAGAFISDWIGPRLCLAVFVLIQGLTGLLMSGLYPILAQPQNIGGFIFIFGMFLAFGEVGPGDNIGLIASKTCSTSIRGQYYGVAAAVGKIGAFVGTYIFPILAANAGNGDDAKGGQATVYLSSGLCILSAIIAFFCLPHIGQDTITAEDLRFRAYLESHGWDTSQMGIKKVESFETEPVVAPVDEKKA